MPQPAPPAAVTTPAESEDASSGIPSRTLEVSVASTTTPAVATTAGAGAQKTLDFGCVPTKPIPEEKQHIQMLEEQQQMQMLEEQMLEEQEQQQMQEERQRLQEEEEQHQQLLKGNGL
eukprot:CAMPEP_0174964750 /NCGR_PEP_ID=MMETSP0004_2-20121128/6048_1 /TAXON_ID=420556 /ORGANISM="Ochromonas sp., Strain CCMP1393" /LENGTH=117 /DNA_ID=CAMNT_0016213499 /DNA_START=768 /DNA_END=1121 /DNA_ORIENTATION=+